MTDAMSCIALIHDNAPVRAALFEFFDDTARVLVNAEDDCQTLEESEGFRGTSDISDCRTLEESVVDPVSSTVKLDCLIEKLRVSIQSAVSPSVLVCAQIESIA